MHIKPCLAVLQGAVTWRIERRDPRVIARLLWKFHELFLVLLHRNKQSYTGTENTSSAVAVVNLYADLMMECGMKVDW